jgi:hypothetical protein
VSSLRSNVHSVIHISIWHVEIKTKEEVEEKNYWVNALWFHLFIFFRLSCLYRYGNGNGRAPLYNIRIFDDALKLSVVIENSKWKHSSITILLLCWCDIILCVTLAYYHFANTTVATTNTNVVYDFSNTKKKKKTYVVQVNEQHISHLK